MGYKNKQNIEIESFKSHFRFIENLKAILIFLFLIKIKTILSNTEF